MPPDPEKYLPLLSGLDLSRTGKLQLIHSLWPWLQTLVDQELARHAARIDERDDGQPDSPPPRLALDFNRTRTSPPSPQRLSSAPAEARGKDSP